MNYFENLLIDRGNCYEINLELEVRKLFEKSTSYIYEFQKNDNIYEYDIKVFKYLINGGNWDKKHIYNIEVEVSEKWENEYPTYWKYYSFLARKVFIYDYNNKMFTNKFRPDYDKTIYIIFNKKLNDCFCQTVEYISKLNLNQKNITGITRTDTFLRTELSDKNIIRGIKNCLNFTFKNITNVTN